MKKILFLFYCMYYSLAVSSTYYIDATNGNDLNDGLARSTCWQSIDKVNKKTFSPGDSILLKCGEIWNTGLEIADSGTEDNPLVFSCYGNGPNPKIDLIGQDKGHGIQFNKSRGNTYCIVRYIDVLNAGTNGIVIVNGGHHNIISHCGSYNSKQNGIRLVGTKTNRISYSIVEYCTVENVINNDGITLHKGSDTENDLVGTGNIIRFNTVSECNEQGIDLTSGDNTLALGNLTFNSNGGVVVGHQATYVTIDRHFSINDDKGSTGAVQFKNSNHVVLKNSIIVGDDILFKTAENPGEGKPKNIQIWNNTFYQSGRRESKIILIDGLDGPIEFYNNIFYTKTPIKLENPAIGHEYYTFNSNLYYQSLAAFKIFNNLYSLDEFQSNFNQELDGINVDPDFVNTSGNYSEAFDYKLGLDSPAIDAAKDIDVKLDFEGKTRPIGKALDIGAYEFDPKSTVLNDSEAGIGRPCKFTLLQNYPNPFNINTTVNYLVQGYNKIILQVFNNNCQLVKTLVNKYHSPGKYSVSWDASDSFGQTVSSGIYFYKMASGEFTQFKKMILIK